MFGIPADQADNVVWRGGTSALGEVISADAAAGVQRLVFSVAAGDWFRQTSVLAERLHS
ncbi:MAG: hypothetical protein JO020_10090 [Chloroflexi bacterium]|nr:hypothetical protein [Chloroflexota bacterium]